MLFIQRVQRVRLSFLTLRGVALAAIQGLNLKLEEKQAEIDSLKKEFTEQFASLEQRLLAMEASMN